MVIPGIIHIQKTINELNRLLFIHLRVQCVILITPEDKEAMISRGQEGGRHGKDWEEKMEKGKMI